MSKKYIKIISVFIILSVLLLFFPSSANAAGSGGGVLGEEIEDILSDQLKNSGAEDLYDKMPSETEKYLQELGISEINISSILNLNIGEIFGLIGKITKDYFGEIAATFAAVLGVVMVSVIMDVMKDNFSSTKIGEVFNMISMLCLITIVSTPIITVVNKVVSSINNGTLFISALLPVLTGIMMAGGQMVTGTTYNMIIYGVCQVVSNLASTVIVPLISIYLGFCITSSVSEKLNLEKAAESVKKCASWILGLAVTLFVGLLTTQTLVTTSADSAIAKAGKFVINSAVPIVGGPLSDAVATIQGCLSLLKNVVGVFGILSALLIFLPVLLECVLWIVLLQVTAFVGDIFSVKSIPGLMRSISSAMSLLCTVLICSGVLVIVSTTVILLLGGKGV